MPCHEGRDVSLDIRIYHYQKQDNLGCFLQLQLPHVDLHVEPDHQSSIARLAIQNPIKLLQDRQTGLELLQVEGACVCRTRIVELVYTRHQLHLLCPNAYLNTYVYILEPAGT